MAFDVATGPHQDLKKFRLIGGWTMRLKDKELSRLWTRLEYHRLVSREKLAGLQAAHAVPTNEKSAPTRHLPVPVNISPM
jgi:hypothetical protein